MKFWDCLLKTVIIQCIAAGVVIITVLVIKFCFTSTFSKLSTWYVQNVLVDTDINEVIT